MGSCKPDSVASPPYGRRADDHSSKRPIPGTLPAPEGAGQMRTTSPSPIWSCSGRGLPCLADLSNERWALTPPFHPYHTPKGMAVCFLLRYPSRGVWSAVSSFSTGLPVLWSPDFPPALRRAAVPCPYPRRTIAPPPLIPTGAENFTILTPRRPIRRFGADDAQ